MRTHDFHYGDLLARNARQHADQAALVDGTAVLTHAQLHARCRAVASGLAAQGVRAGDRIALLSHNRPEVLVLLGGAALCGATLVLLNARASATETAAVVADAEVALVVLDPTLAPLAAEMPPQTVLHAFDLGTAAHGLRPWTQLLGTPDPVPTPVDAASPLVGIPTAAVDGRPRIAVLSHAAVLHQALLLAQAWALTPADRHLCVLPLFHAAGLSLTLAGQMVGAASVLLARFEPTAALQAIAQWRVSYFASFAPILGSLLDAADTAPETSAPLASLRVVTGLESPETAARLAARCPGARFWRGYGQSETAGIISLAPCTGDAAAAGTPLPTVALRIERPDGSEADAGESGEIVLRSPCVFSGYWRRPAESAHAARGGWHHTGDLGRLDAQGHLRFEGRAPEKALIKSGGENIYPAEVEQALLAHPGIEAAVVFGVPDARWGEAVRAVCVRRAGHAVESADLVAFVEGRIARFKRPRDVVFAARLPQRADGTVDRAAVVAQHAHPSAG